MPYGLNSTSAGHEYTRRKEDLPPVWFAQKRKGGAQRPQRGIDTSLYLSYSFFAPLALLLCVFGEADFIGHFGRSKPSRTSLPPL
jgi:hypothetical protein